MAQTATETPLSAMAHPAPPGQSYITTTIADVVKAGTPILLVKSGMSSSEGPVGAPDGSLYFSEPSFSILYKVDPSDKITVVFNPHKEDNPKGERWRMPGLGMNSKGQVLAARRAGSQIGIGIVYPLKQQKFLATAYQGTPFAAPNDLSVAKDDGIYFTEQGNPEQGAQRPHCIYYVKPSGDVILATGNIASPNGLALSPDEKTLYAVDSRSEYVYAYEVQPDHTLANRRNFARLKGILQTDRGMNNGIDGMIVDNDGRAYVISNAGIEVFSPAGEALGIIPVPVKAQNLAFAGKDGHTLYIVGHGNLYKIAMLSRKIAQRAK